MALVAQLDASGLGLQSGDVVTNWGGQSAGGTPTFLTGQTVNGKPAVEFNGGGDRMGSNVSLSPSAAGDWIVAAVIKPQSIGAYHNVVDDDASNRPMLWVDSSFNYELNFSGGTGAKGAGQGIDGWDLVIADSRLNQLYVNSPTPNATGRAPVAFTAPETFDFFHRDFSQTFRGLVAELRIYNDAADFNNDFAALHNELAGKWFGAAAIPDSATTNEDVSVTIDVLANDRPDQGGTLAITSVSAPNFGTAVVDDGGTTATDDDTIIYTPSANDNGTASFEYTIDDGSGNNFTATVTVEVAPVNDAPSITSADAVNVAENQTTVIDVQSIDPDGNTESGGGLIYSLTGGADQAAFNIDPNTGVLTFSTAPNFESPTDVSGDNVYEVQVTVADGVPSGVSEQIDAWFNLSGVMGWTEAPFGNDWVPVAAVNTNSVGVTLPYSGQALPAGKMILHAGPPNGGKDQSVVRWTAPSAGSLALDTTFFKLHSNLVNTYVFHNGVQIASGNTGSGSYTFNSGTINVQANDTIDFILSTKQYGYGSTSTGFDAEINFTTNGGVQTVYEAASDLKANQLSPNKMNNPNGAWSYGTAATVGGVMTLFQTPNFPLTDVQDIAVTVTNIIEAGDESVTTEEDVAITIDVLANDNIASAGTLAITSVSTPNFGTAVVDDGGTAATDDDKIVYTPSANDSGTATFEYTIGDGLGGTASAFVTVEVTPVNDAPVVDLNGVDESGIDFATIFTGAATSLSDADALLTDIDGGVIGSATAGNGEIFVVNRDGRVTKIDPDTGAQTAISNGALIIDARGLAIDDATGDIYVADARRRAIVKVDRNSGAESIVASGFRSMWGIAVEADGNVLVTDRSYRSIIRVDPATGGKTTVRNGLYDPYGVEVASDGTILVADGRYLRKIDPANGNMTSTGLLPFWFYDIAENSNGDLLVTDYGRIRQVDFTTSGSTIVSTSYVYSYFISVNGDDDIVASSYGQSRVRVVDGATGTDSILAIGGNLSRNIGMDIDGGVAYGDNIASMTVSITNLLDGTDEVLAADVSGTNITASYDSGAGVLSLTGDDTAANYQMVLRTVTYNNTAATPTSTARVISFVANDGLDNSQPVANATVVLNRPPTIDSVNLNPIEENSAEGTAVGQVVASDPDGDTLAYTIADSRFVIDSSGNITVAAGAVLDYETETSITTLVSVSDGIAAPVEQDITIELLNVTATISGMVFVDANEDGDFDGGAETGIDGVTIALLDDTFTEIGSDTTSLGGVYAFEVDDEFGTYRILETQPTGVEDGIEIAGTGAASFTLNPDDGAGNLDDVIELTLAGGDTSDWDFSEIGQGVESGDTATIGFWQNKNGQALIEEGGTALVDWLNDNFSNIFGSTFTDAGSDAAEVASFYKQEFFKKKLRGTAKVDAQFMATALATFFTSSNLSGGTVAASYGFNVTEAGLGSKVVNVGSSGAAFDVADDTDMTVMAMLLATNSLTGADTDGDDSEDYSHVYDANGDGILDDTEKAMRAMANNLYSWINESGDI